MGSKASRIVTKTGGWLKPNSYKLLHAMAMDCYDEPHGPNGPKEDPPHICFQSAETLAWTAFGRFMPDEPDVQEGTEMTTDQHHALSERNSIANLLQRAVKDLVNLGVIRRLRPARAGQHTAMYEIDLKQLGVLSSERLMEATGMPHFEEKQQIVVSSPVDNSGSGDDGDESPEPKNNKLLVAETTNCCLLPDEKQQFVVSDGLKNNKLLPHIDNSLLTTLSTNNQDKQNHLGSLGPPVDNSSSDQKQNSPGDPELDRQAQLAALEAHHPELRNPK